MCVEKSERESSAESVSTRKRERESSAERECVCGKRERERERERYVVVGFHLLDGLIVLRIDFGSGVLEEIKEGIARNLEREREREIR